MLSVKFATILFITSCFISVHSLSLKNKNPQGLKGEALKNFTGALYENRAKFENIPFAKQVFITFAGKKYHLTKEDIKAFLTNTAVAAGGSAPPKFYIDRFYNEANTKNDGKITFGQFQNAMITILTLDIVDFENDILKEDPTWKYVPK